MSYGLEYIVGNFVEGDGVATSILSYATMNATLSCVAEWRLTPEQIDSILHKLDLTDIYSDMLVFYNEYYMVDENSTQADLSGVLADNVTFVVDFTISSNDTEIKSLSVLDVRATLPGFVSICNELKEKKEQIKGLISLPLVDTLNTQLGEELDFNI